MASTSRERIELYGIDAICERMASGMSLHKIAREISVPVMTLFDWVDRDPVYVARLNEARKRAAEMYAAKAEEVIEQADDAIGVAKARELATHYRWLAKSLSPRYRDKQEIEHSGNISVADALKALSDKPV